MTEEDVRRIVREELAEARTIVTETIRPLTYRVGKGEMIEFARLVKEASRPEA